MKVLVIAAHPDDEVLGCGAIISKLSDEGNRVSIAILGEGVTSRFSKREDADETLINNLKEKSKIASRILGAQEVFYYDLPDNRFDEIPLLDIVKKAEVLIQEVKPEAVFTHSSFDLNIDHVITQRAVLTATRPMKGCPVKDVYSFEIPSSTEWSFGELGKFQPNTFFDVTKFIDRKIEALEIYESEMREFPHPRSRKAVKNLGMRWGSVVGVEYAEAFQLIRSIR